MPRSAGWTQAYQTNQLFPVFSTAASVNLSTHSPAINDVALLVLAHKSADWAVVPAGWTLVAREVTAPVRLEIYWRRVQSGDPSAVTVTGLSTATYGVIVPYGGGLLAGSPVAGVTVVTHPANTPELATGLTTMTPQTLLVHLVATPADYVVSPIETTGPDPAIFRWVYRVAGQAAAGGGLGFAMHDILKVLPGDTGGTVAYGGNPPQPTIVMMVALTPETVAATAGTRYYLAAKHTNVHLWALPQGGWLSQASGPRLTPFDAPLRLSQTKGDAGAVVRPAYTSNRTPGDYLAQRWLTPPLAAQAISGTLSLLLHTAVTETSGSPSCSVQVKLHVYVAVGQSLTPRATLLANYLDATVLTVESTIQWRQIPAQTLPAVSCEEGDCVVVEVGYHLTAAGAWPTPTRPPTQYATVRMIRGATTVDAVSAGYYAGVGVPDATVGETSLNRAAYLDFSQTLVEQAPPVPPSNTTWDTALVIPPVLPYLGSPIDTTTVPLSERPLWYQWTPATSGRVILHAWSSTALLTIDIGTNPPTFTLAPTEGWTAKWVVGSLATVVLDVTAGTPYYIRALCYRSGYAAVDAGGTVRLTIVARQPLAHNDVVLAASGFVVRYTQDGVLADVQADFTQLTISGLAIDYSRRPMVDQWDGSTHTGERLYLGLFGYDIVEILDLETLNVGRGEIDYLLTWVGAVQNLSSIAMTRAGQAVVAWFGNGFTLVGDGSVSYQYDSSTLGTANLQLWDGLLTENAPGAPLVNLPATLEAGGTNYVEFGPDDRTVFYTSGGWYVPRGGQVIHRLNVETGEQLPPFATVPVGPGDNPGLKGLFPLADGSCLACNGGEVVWLDASGAVARSYRPTPSARAQSLADVELDSDGFFWVLDEHSTSLFKFDVLTGAQVVDVPTWLSSGSCTSIVVYRRATPWVPPGGCLNDYPRLPSGCGEGYPLLPAAGADVYPMLPLGGDCMDASTFVVNMALQEIGITKTITDLGTDQSQEGYAARLIFSDVLDTVLRDHPWKFATEYAVLTWNAGSPAAPSNPDWVYTYNLPDDCVRVRRVCEPLMQRRYTVTPIPFDQRADVNGIKDLLLCNEPGAGQLEPPAVGVEPTIAIEYTKRFACPAQVNDAQFRECLVHKLGARLAKALGRDSKDADRCLRNYGMALPKAQTQHANSQERQRPTEGPPDWITGR